MSGAIATVLTTARVIPKVGTDLRGQNRQAYDELIELQAEGDPELASPYLAADAVATIAANGGTSGNMTITVNFPKYGVAVTTANVLYNAAAAAVQTAIDAALAGETILATYVADDVKVGACVNMSAAVCPITANGTTVAKANMVVTTTNADLDVAAPAVTANTVGTNNRPAEAILAAYSVVTPVTIPSGQGESPTAAEYTTGDNPSSISPGLKDLLVSEIQVSEDAPLGTLFREVIGCV